MLRQKYESGFLIFSFTRLLLKILAKKCWKSDFFLAKIEFLALFGQDFKKMRKNKKPRHILCLNMRDFQAISAFLTQRLFLQPVQDFLTKKRDFCHFVKKSTFLVQSDIENGFSDSFLSKNVYLYIFTSKS